MFGKFRSWETSGITESPFPQLTGGEDLQAAPTCRTQFQLRDGQHVLDEGLILTFQKGFCAQHFEKSLHEIFIELASGAFKLRFDLCQIDLHVTFANQFLSSRDLAFGAGDWLLSCGELMGRSWG